MYIYGIKDGIYTRELIIPEGETIHATEERIDCTKFTPDANGAPVEIVVEAPIYVVPTEREVFTAGNDIYGNSANDSLCSAGNDVLYSAGNDTLTYGNLT